MLIKPISIKINADKAYLIPIGDVHLGSKNSDLKKLLGYVEWVRNTKYSYVFLMGDIFDVATRESESSPFEQEMGINEAMNTMTNIIKPIRKKIIGCISGNHERRLRKYAGLDLLETWCRTNNITYCEDSCVISFDIRSINYVFFAHHTMGGGQTIGGKLNRVAKLVTVFSGADCYLGGHNHSKALGEDAIYYYNHSTGKVDSKRIMYVDCGSFYAYDNSYAEAAALPPSHTGAPRIRMSGTKKDLHISF
ncbi:MAG: metallophosphoesterase [Candidatus Freyarchaeota archaeon]|nr:metallophosphoesterase [Candidatus Jordarchaeia archaeon]